MTWQQLLADLNFSGIAESLISSTDIDWDLVREDPFTTINALQSVSVSVQDDLSQGCGGGGYYDHKTKVIYLHPTHGRRDNFTLLHEFGHHLQRSNEEWEELLLFIGRQQRIEIEEKVSNHLASLVLLPRTLTDVVDSSIRPAEYMSARHRTSQASLAAVIKHTHALLQEQNWILVASTPMGEVITSLSTYHDFPPAKQHAQPGFITLAEEADAGPVIRHFWEGLRYRDGGLLEGLEAQSALSLDGATLFVALRPTSLHGKGARSVNDYECARDACGAVFTSEEVERTCPRCEAPHCPACDDCACELDGSGEEACTKCFMLVPRAQLLTGTHDCY